MITKEDLNKLQLIAKYSLDGGDSIRTFNCATFYRYVTGIDVSIIPTCESGRKKDIMNAIESGKKYFNVLEEPTGYCIVSLSQLKLPHHIGVFIDGHVWHMEKNGLICSTFDNLKANGYTWEFGELKNG